MKNITRTPEPEQIAPIACKVPVEKRPYSLPALTILKIEEIAGGTHYLHEGDNGGVGFVS